MLGVYVCCFHEFYTVIIISGMRACPYIVRMLAKVCLEFLEAAHGGCPIGGESFVQTSIDNLIEELTGLGFVRTEVVGGIVQGKDF
jgi:hypothetical protein